MPDRTSPRAWLAPAAWRPHLKLIAAIGSVALAITVLTLFLAGSRQAAGPATAVPPTAAASPVATAPIAASPAGAVAWPPGSLPALLTMAPDWLDAAPGLPIQATYADINGWLAAQGADPAALDEAAFQRALAPLPLPEPVRANGLSAAWRQYYGFDLRQVDAVLAVGEAPNLVLIMPGRYDAEALYATWVANGYQAVEVEETTVWSLVPGDRIDLSAPASRPALGMLNTVVVLDDGTLVATARQSLMAQALRAARGEGRSLAGRDGLRQALPGSVDALAAILATDELLAVPSAGIAGTPVAARPLPAVDLILFTVPPPGGSRAAIEMTLVLAHPPDDPAALRLALAARVAADPAWSAHWRIERVAIGGEGQLVELAIAGVSGEHTGLALADPAELGPFRGRSGD